VHADFSEYNLLWLKGTLYVIDVSQARHASRHGARHGARHGNESRHVTSSHMSRIRVTAWDGTSRHAACAALFVRVVFRVLLRPPLPVVFAPTMLTLGTRARVYLCVIACVPRHASLRVRACAFATSRWSTTTPTPSPSYARTARTRSPSSGSCASHRRSRSASFSSLSRVRARARSCSQQPAAAAWWRLPRVRCGVAPRCAAATTLM
jgi:hypothetical protein